MANEIGYWNGGAGAVSQAFFAADSAAPVGSAVHAAGAGETITMVRIAFRGTNLQTSCKIGLFATSAGLPTGSPIYTPVTISGITGAGTYSSSVSWALTNGVSYALAFGEANSLGNLSSDTQANGTSYDDVTGSLASFTHRSYKGNIIELAGDITAASGIKGRSPFVSPMFNSKVIQ